MACRQGAQGRGLRWQPACLVPLGPCFEPLEPSLASFEIIQVARTIWQREEKLLHPKPSDSPFEHCTEACGCSVCPLSPSKAARFLTLDLGGLLPPFKTHS